MTLLAFDNVVAGYGPIVVLNGLSIAIGAGEIVAVLGANGSGKSTALKTASGLTRMVSGSVTFDGADISALPAHRRAALGIGYVPQNDNVFADLTVDDNLRMGGYMYPERLASDSAAVFELFPVLAERRGQIAGSLSGGERRMLAIGLTLFLRPKVLLLDEPSSDLAPATIDTVFAAIARIHAEFNVPILLVEQNVDQALALATRVCVLVRGRAALDSPTDEVEMDELRALFLDSGGEND
jgi:ABC-type branched-subunit amino acid transport system ATPase component